MLFAKTEENALNLFCALPPDEKATQESSLATIFCHTIKVANGVYIWWVKIHDVLFFLTEYFIEPGLVLSFFHNYVFFERHYV